MNKKDIIIDYNLDKNGNKTLKHIDIITKSHPIEPVILLPQIPNEFNKIEVIFNNKHLIRVDKIRDLDNADKIYIDYSKQKIYIHKDLMHKDLKVRYSGIGALKFDVNNINYNQEDKLSIIESIDKVANNGEKIFEECLSEGFADKQEVLNELLTKIALGNKSIKDIDNVIKNIDLDNIANNMTNSTTKIDNIEQEIVKARSNKSNVKTRLDIQENNINECKDELNGINDRLSLIKTNIENLTINIGDLALLKTKNKKNIVEALNELAKKVGIVIVPPIVYPTTWTTLDTTMPTRRYYFACGIVGDNIYCIGGRPSNNKNECYNITNGVWTEKATTPRNRDVLGSATVGDKIYLIGGDINSYKDTNLAECYDTLNDTYTTLTSMSTARQNLTCVSVGTDIYAIGGLSELKFYATLEKYNTLTDTWVTLTPMSTARGYTMCAVVEEKIYVIGGSNGNALNTVECYDIATDNWTTKTSMPISIIGGGCVAIGKKIYVIGGETSTSGGYVNTVYVYNTVTDTWTEEDSMNIARDSLSCVAYNNKIYAIGGYNTGGALNTVEVFE